MSDKDKKYVLHGSSATAMSCMLVGVEESWRVLVSGGAITGASEEVAT